MPLNMNPGAEWVCGTCYASKPAEKVKQAINNYWDLMEKTPTYDVKALLQLLPKLLRVFDENHYYPLEVKRRIIENIGEAKGYEYEDLAEAWLEKKVNFCRDHLKVQRKLAPGLSEYRAYISYHLAEPLYWLAKKQYIEKKCSSEDLSKTMDICWCKSISKPVYLQHVLSITNQNEFQFHLDSQRVRTLFFIAMWLTSMGRRG